MINQQVVRFLFLKPLSSCKLLHVCKQNCVFYFRNNIKISSVFFFYLREHIRQIQTLRCHITIKTLENTVYDLVLLDETENHLKKKS